MSAKCQATVNISGEIVSQNGSSKPFNISKESIMPTFMCEGATNSLRAASADAINVLVNEVRNYDK